MGEAAGTRLLDLAAAAAAIARGDVVAYPTETFYGLAVAALDEAALARLLAVKGRGAEKTTSVIVADAAMAVGLCAEVPPIAARLMAAFWPGPLTLALPARAGLPAALVGDGCVAMRVSPHPLAAALVAACGGPITATSANPAGQPPARTIDEVAAAFPAGAHAAGPWLLDGGTTAGGAPSTLVRVRGARWEVLRAGVIDPDKIAAVVSADPSR